MRSLALRLAVCAVRAWTRAYTGGLPAALAEERRAEIESDLWELQHDPDPAPGWSPAAQVAARLVIGLPDDVFWRVERTTIEHILLPRHLVVLTAIFLLLAWWILPATSARDRQRGGGTRVADCAATATAPKSTAEFRLQVLECAGAFFTRSARQTTTGPE